MRIFLFLEDFLFFDQNLLKKSCFRFDPICSNLLHFEGGYVCFLLFDRNSSFLQKSCSHPCVLSSHSKTVKTKVLKTVGSLMQVKSIAECSLGAFCNTFDLQQVIRPQKYWIVSQAFFLKNRCGSAGFYFYSGKKQLREIFCLKLVTLFLKVVLVIQVRP